MPGLWVFAFGVGVAVVAPIVAASLQFAESLYHRLYLILYRFRDPR
jgi:hypothetical protein